MEIHCNLRNVQQISLNINETIFILDSMCEDYVQSGAFLGTMITFPYKYFWNVGHAMISPNEQALAASFVVSIDLHMLNLLI